MTLATLTKEDSAGYLQASVSVAEVERAKCAAVNSLIAGKLKKAGIDLSRAITTTCNDATGTIFFTQDR